MPFANGLADFRSDTVTHPTDEMRRAMAAAPVGDDVYGEDPTVNALEDEAAAALGMEASLYVPSGTMGNQIAMSLATRPGDEVICSPTAHVRQYEGGGASVAAGIAFRTVDTPDGSMAPDAILTAIEGPRYGLPRVSLLSWENTHNVSGGTVVPLDTLGAGSAVAHDAGLSVHIDGARLWNAVAASAIPGSRWAAHADTVMFCLSKGLAAPVGSLLCGSSDFIAEARSRRARFGGAMRQAGIIAAAGRIALRDRDRLTDDHVLAKTLGEGIAARYPGSVEPARVQTNMVRVDAAALPVSGAELVDRLRADEVLVGLIDATTLRFVTHLNLDEGDVKKALSLFDSLSD